MKLLLTHFMLYQRRTKIAPGCFRPAGKQPTCRKCPSQTEFRTDSQAPQPRSTSPPAHIERIVHISCRTQCIRNKNIDGTSYLSTTSIIRTVAPILIISGLDVSQPKIVCPKSASMPDRITVIITDFFITYFPIRKAACGFFSPIRCPIHIAPPCAIEMLNR